MKKIEKVREDIRKTREKLRELEEHLKTLQARERQLCDEEVARAMREMTGKNGDVLETLRMIQQAQDPVYGNRSEFKEELAHES